MGLRNPEPSVKVFVTVCVIVMGVMLASFGEVEFVFTGFIIQLFALAFEAYKNALQQSLLSGKTNMSSMTLLYYFAPICTITNTVFILIFEVKALRETPPSNISPWIFLANGILTFTLNIASVNVVSTNKTPIFL